MERIAATLVAAGEPLPMREIALRLNCPLDGKFRNKRCQIKGARHAIPP